MGAEQKKSGQFGEETACAYLTEKGYRVTARNFRCRFGEVDVIAETSKYLVFVEVKLRKDASFAEAREFVTPAKQRRVILTAQYWLRAHPTKKQPRFDVIEVYGAAGHIEAVNHIENAFGV